ncbi:branched-chain amino acid dehydrogenase [Streptococcus sp. HMSC066E07]|uniref:3-oxoacid CoA-transferase, A subunit n=1 Tax=Streptococcus anginosus SK1138 TaxID=1161422 RepID=A0AAD2T7B0_STRAP|nr:MULTISPECIES: 3-oxoacid CoA-transferase subunit A [Streptococcus]EJP24919.1 3-oxoacid CoA-transferase, A subunit [Streptococcus anginosus SK1138]MCY7223312.1 3-oxoacid CoA-transferase subunit A [Streptococcus anginosus]OFP45232.1 branched-chain amino acid dehydrogenase [Streptococcus sp. HMSC066E07]RIB36840.1 CoA transferase subunit A [Streptococcus anginosus]
MQIVTLSEAISNIKSEDIVGISGFLGVGEPFELIEELVRQNQQNLTIVSVVTSQPGKEIGVGRLCENHQVKKYIAAHVGTSAAAQHEYFSGDMEVEFTPMGTVVERLHAAGAGLGAVLTPTGVGTILEKDYEKVARNGREYLVYDPLKIDVALIKATKSDKYGNLYIDGTTKNISLQLALAADTVIVEANEIVEVGEIDPNDVYIPGILVDYVVESLTSKEHHKMMGDLWIETKKLAGVN